MTTSLSNENYSGKPYALDKLGNTYRLQLKAITHQTPETFKDVNMLIDHITRHQLKEQISGLECLPEYQYRRLFPVEPKLLSDHAAQLMNKEG